MGWWQAENGDILGDGPLNILDQFEAIRGRIDLRDFPEAVVDAIRNEYETDLGRGPTDSELASLLALHRGDRRLGVMHRIVNLQPPALD